MERDKNDCTGTHVHTTSIFLTTLCLPCFGFVVWFCFVGFFVVVFFGGLFCVCVFCLCVLCFLSPTLCKMKLLLQINSGFQSVTS